MVSIKVEASTGWLVPNLTGRPLLGTAACRATMQEYRAYLIGPDGHITGRVDLICETETTAKQQAKQLVDAMTSSFGRVLKSWHGSITTSKAALRLRSRTRPLAVARALVVIDDAVASAGVAGAPRLGTIDLDGH